MDVEGEAQCFHPCMAGQAWCEVGVNIALSGFGELWKQTPPVRCQDAVEGGLRSEVFHTELFKQFLHKCSRLPIQNGLHKVGGGP